jgi:hypothetical protein
VASDLTLLIFDPTIGAMVCSRWLGMSATLEKARSVLGRPPTHSGVGTDCWSDVAPTEAILIAEASYEHGATPQEVTEYSKRFPSPHYWWLLERDY